MSAAHAILGASSAHRWWNCPGSIKLSEGVERKTSSYAEEGTAAHALAEHCLKNSFDASEFVGWFQSKEGDYSQTDHTPGTDFFREITPDMAEAVQVYVDLVRPWLEDPKAECYIEQRLDLSELYPGMFGTADFVGYWPETGTLRVVDYKHGQGIAVAPQDNPQLLYYGYGTMLRYGNRGVTEIELIVVQPRCPSADGPVRRWSIDALGMLDFASDLVAAAKRVEMATDQHKHIALAEWRAAYTDAGEWCKFCPAFPVCPTAYEKTVQAAQAAFTEKGEVVLSEPGTFGPEKLAEILKQSMFIGDWIKRVQEHAHHEAESGRTIPGFKLVPKRATRKWKSEADAKAEMVFVLGVDEDKLYEEPKLKSPAQMEKVVPGKNAKVRAAAIAHLVESVSSGTNLVPVGDAREAVPSEAASAFTAVEG